MLLTPSLGGGSSLNGGNQFSISLTKLQLPQHRTGFTHLWFVKSGISFYTNLSSLKVCSMHCIVQFSTCFPINTFATMLKYKVTANLRNTSAPAKACLIVFGTQATKPQSAHSKCYRLYCKPACEMQATMVAETFLCSCGIGVPQQLQ